MGWRYQRRINLAGGLGVNLSKSGVSMSLRTPFGTIGNRGYSVRTPIRGVSWRKYNAGGGGGEWLLIAAVLLVAPVVIGVLIYVLVRIAMVLAAVARYLGRWVIRVITRNPGSASASGPAAPLISPVHTSSAFLEVLFKCPSCATHYSANVDMVGSSIKCHQCERPLVVPGGDVYVSCPQCTSLFKVAGDSVNEVFTCTGCDAEMPPALHGNGGPSLMEMRMPKEGNGVAGGKLGIRSSEEGKGTLPPASSLSVTKPYEFPPLSLLSLPVIDRRGRLAEARAQKQVIIETLGHFEIRAKMSKPQIVPPLTWHILAVGNGVTAARIGSLKNNLALALQVPEVSIEHEGRTVRIGVPVATQGALLLREVLEGKHWHPDQMELPVVLGRRPGGKDVVFDLASAPHLLLAGRTGVGKSVCMNTIISSLLMSRSPDQLGLMLIDPTVVEFASYGGLPHILGSKHSILTTPDDVDRALRWLVTEMARRLNLLAGAGVRNIGAFNSRPMREINAEALTQAEEDQSFARLGHILVAIDGFQDLTPSLREGIEPMLAELAERAGPAGIHLVIATQCPSVESLGRNIAPWITCRGAFQLQDRHDCMAFLDLSDTKGLDCGEMLFKGVGASEVIPLRVAMTADADIRRMVTFIKNQYAMQTEPVLV